jgi:hypothetical protein
MKHATSRELFCYWSRLRAQRAAPERGDIEPASIRNILADTFILEVDGGGDFPIRVMGARVSAIFARELKGEAFASLWRDEDRPCLRGLIGAVLDDALPAIAGAGANPPGHARLELELVLLPLRHHGRTHARILGALSPSAVPPWFGLVPAQPMTLTSLRIIGADEHRARLSETMAANSDASDWRTLASPARRGHLFVHQGGAGRTF